MRGVNRRIVLARRPNGVPVEEDFRLEKQQLPVLKKDELLLKNQYISLTPGDRSFMNRAIELNSVMRAHTLARIVDPNGHRNYKKDELVVAKGGWQLFSTASEESIKPIPLAWDPITVNLWILGAQGLTAYFGLLDIGRPKPGETVLISGATGAVGSIAGQIAKKHGCRVVGICQNDPRRKQWLVNELKFDAVASESDLENSLSDSCPNGVDIYFDNTGGIILDTVLKLIGEKGANRSRIICCGMVSQYNRKKGEEAFGVQRLHTLINRRVHMKGFIVGDYKESYPEALTHLKQWLKDGDVRYKEDITIGPENTPSAFMRSVRRQSFGKSLVQV